MFQAGELFQFIQKIYVMSYSCLDCADSLAPTECVAFLQVPSLGICFTFVTFTLTACYVYTYIHTICVQCMFDVASYGILLKFIML